MLAESACCIMQTGHWPASANLEPPGILASGRVCIVDISSQQFPGPPKDPRTLCFALRAITVAILKVQFFYLDLTALVSRLRRLKDFVEAACSDLSPEDLPGNCF